MSKAIIVTIFVVATFSPLVVALICLILESIQESPKKKNKIFQLLGIPEGHVEQRIWFDLLERKLFCDLKEGDIFIVTNNLSEDYDIKEHTYIKQDNKYINISGNYLIKIHGDDDIVRVITVSERDRKKIAKLTKTEWTIKI